jgi:cobalamin biosynthesis Mg chelatase CobN
MTEAQPEVIPESVTTWLKDASPEQLRRLGAERLLEAARRELKSKGDPALSDLAAEVEDILRRCAAEQAAK